MFAKILKDQSGEVAKRALEPGGDFDLAGVLEKEFFDTERKSTSVAWVRLLEVVD